MKVYGSLLSFGSEEVFKFSRKARAISGKLIGLERSEMSWGGGGGRFTPLMAAAAAAYVRDKIRSQGKGLPAAVTRPITKKWRKAKEMYAGKSALPIGPHYASGSLYEHIKVLQRRARGKARHHTVGVDMRASVPHFGYGGINPERMVKIASYAHNIEVGADQPRPLIISAIIAFAEEVWPTGKKTLQNARDKYLKDNFSEKALKKMTYKDTLDSEIERATKKMIKTLVTECGYSQEAAIEMANAVKK